MANRSSCRFRNTSSDLSDCAEALERVCAGEESLSPEEARAAQSLIQHCLRIVANIRDYANDPDHEAIERKAKELIQTASDRYNQ